MGTEEKQEKITPPLNNNKGRPKRLKCFRQIPHTKDVRKCKCGGLVLKHTIVCPTCGMSKKQTTTYFQYEKKRMEKYRRVKMLADLLIILERQNLEKERDGKKN